MVVVVHDLDDVGVVALGVNCYDYFADDYYSHGMPMCCNKANNTDFRLHKYTPMLPTGPFKFDSLPDCVFAYDDV